MRITISGPPGSGKTTVSSILSERLGIRSVVFGRIFRELASELGLSLSQLGDMAETDRTIDEKIDSKILEIACEEENVILESRLSAHMLTNNGIEAFKVYLDASPDVRAERICRRDSESVEEAKINTIARETSEAKRYSKYYGIDINDMSVYDLIIRTDNITPEEVAQIIIDVAEEKC